MDASHGIAKVPRNRTGLAYAIAIQCTGRTPGVRTAMNAASGEGRGLATAAFKQDSRLQIIHVGRDGTSIRVGRLPGRDEWSGTTISQKSSGLTSGRRVGWTVGRMFRLTRD